MINNYPKKTCSQTQGTIFHGLEKKTVCVKFDPERAKIILITIVIIISILNRKFVSYLYFHMLIT